MLKLGWQMLEFLSKLWVCIMKAKYGCGPMAMPEVCHHTNPSQTWRRIVAGWHLVQSNIRWVIRNRHRVHFWRDHWLPGIPSLSDLFDERVPMNEQNFSVSHYAKDGSWDWLRLQQHLDDYICQQIAISKPLLPVWMISLVGIFLMMVCLHLSPLTRWLWMRMVLSIRRILFLLRFGNGKGPRGIKLIFGK